MFLEQYLGICTNLRNIKHNVTLDLPTCPPRASHFDPNGMGLPKINWGKINKVIPIEMKEKVKIDFGNIGVDIADFQ